MAGKRGSNLSPFALEVVVMHFSICSRYMRQWQVFLTSGVDIAAVACVVVLAFRYETSARRRAHVERWCFVWRGSMHCKSAIQSLSDSLLTVGDSTFSWASFVYSKFETITSAFCLFVPVGSSGARVETYIDGSRPLPRCALTWETVSTDP